MTAPSPPALEEKFPYSGLFGNYVLAIFIVLCGLMGFVVWDSISELDRQSAENERHIAEVHVRAEADKVSKSLWTALAWDDAVTNLQQSYNADWAEDNIGHYLFDIQNFSYSFVLGPSGNLLFAAEQGKAVPTGAGQNIVIFASELIEDLRKAERSGASERERRAKTMTLPLPVIAQDYVRLNGAPYLVTGMLVTGDKRSRQPVDNRHAIVVTFKKIDRGYFSTLLEAETLGRLMVSQNCASAVEGRNCVEVRGQAPAPAFSLSWNRSVTGGWMSGRIIVLLGFMLVVLVALSVAFLVRGRVIHQRYMQKREQITFMAFHDTLTQLPNRILAFDRLDRMIVALQRDQKWIAVHALDLDLFKAVNDTHGHAEGDALLRMVADRLRRLCRNSDTISRLGGDEFLILQNIETPAQAATLAHRIVRELSKPFELSSGSVRISCSIGTVTTNDAAADATLLVRQADAALYSAKAEGGSGVTFFDEKLDRMMRWRKTMENDLRQAIANGGVSVVYQEIIDRNGACVSVEALARWDHPAGRDIPPQEFIRIAEESHQAFDLGKLVIEKIAEDSHSFSDLRICINLSPSQLRSPRFEECLVEAISTRFSKNCTYELEITETALLSDSTDVVKALHRLREAGYSVALDDFGTGFSSLTQIKSFAFDRIKIDREFVSDIVTDPRARSVVEAVVRLGNDLGLETVAEGVDDEEVFAVLRAIGVPLLQGYILGRPVPVKKIVALIGARQTAAA